MVAVVVVHVHRSIRCTGFCGVRQHVALGAVFGVVTWWQQALEGNCSAAQTAIFAMWCRHSTFVPICLNSRTCWAWELYNVTNPTLHRTTRFNCGFPSQIRATPESTHPPAGHFAAAYICRERERILVYGHDLQVITDKTIKPVHSHDAGPLTDLSLVKTARAVPSFSHGQHCQRPCMRTVSRRRLCHHQRTRAAGRGGLCSDGCRVCCRSCSQGAVAAHGPSS